MTSGRKSGQTWGCEIYSPLGLFTEQGVAMLSSVLKSDRAVHVNIQIMRAFIKMRQMYISHEDLKQKIIAMERKYDKQFQIVFEATKTCLKNASNTQWRLQILF